MGCHIYTRKMSSIGSVTYGIAKELTGILKSLVGKTTYYIKNSKEFADEIRNTKMEEGKYITSFDVTALFTSIPVESVLEDIKEGLEQDTDLQNRKILSASNIIELLGSV